MDFEDLEALENNVVHSEDGQAIGSIAAVHMDQQTDLPLFVEVATQWREQNLIVPIADATFDDHMLVVSYDADDLAQGPLIAHDAAMSVGEVSFVVHYYSAGYVDPEGHSINERPSIPDETERSTAAGYKKKPLPPIVYRLQPGQDDLR
jgi:hypothetical protein